MLPPSGTEYGGLKNTSAEDVRKANLDYEHPAEYERNESSHIQMFNRFKI